MNTMLGYKTSFSVYWSFWLWPGYDETSTDEGRVNKPVRVTFLPKLYTLQFKGSNSINNFLYKTHL